MKGNNLRLVIELRAILEHKKAMEIRAKVMKLCRTSKACLSNWEQGKNCPRPEQLKKICGFFNKPLDFFI